MLIKKDSGDYVKEFLALLRRLNKSKDISFSKKKVLKDILATTYLTAPTIPINKIPEPIPLSDFSDHRLFQVLEFKKKLCLGSITMDDLVLSLCKLLRKCHPKEFLLFKMILFGNIPSIPIKKVSELFPNLSQSPCQFMHSNTYNPDLVLKFPVLVEPKVPGNRIKLLINDQYKGVFDDTSNISQKYTKLLSKFKEPIELDIIASEETLFAFDLIIPFKSLKYRKNKIIEILPNTNLIEPLPFVIVDSERALYKAYHNSIKNGFEGVMIKDLKSHYIKGHSSSWLRLEEIEVLDVLIKEVSKGKQRGKDVVVLVCEKDGKEIFVSEISEGQVEFLMNTRLVGKMCRVTKSDEKYRFLKLRG